MVLLLLPLKSRHTSVNTIFIFLLSWKLKKLCHILSRYPTHVLKNLTLQLQQFLDIHHQVVAPGLTRSELTHQRHPHPISLMHCKLFTPKICCPSTASCWLHHFCIQSYLVCPVSYSVPFQWNLSTATPEPSCPHFIRALTCEDTSGPVSPGVQHWLKCVTGLESVCLAWDNQLFETFRLLCWRPLLFCVCSYLFWQRYCANKVIRALLSLINKSIY